MKYIVIAVVLLVLIVLFKNWWKKNWRSYYGEGIRRFRKKNYYGASEQLFKAKLKNPNKWEIAYYCGLADKHISDRMNSRDAIDTKKFAIASFLDCLVLNPSHLKSKNMIEMILCDEKDSLVLKELIKDTRNKLEKTSNEIKNQFEYINEMGKTLFSDIEKMGMKGQVKFIYEEEFLLSKEDNTIVEGEPYETGIKLEFDKVGKLINSNRNNSNPFIKEPIIAYNEKGIKIEEKLYKPNGKLEWKSTFKYDDNDRLIVKINFNVEGIGLGKITFEYDEQGNKIKSNLYRYDESLYGEILYKYDELGNPLNEYKEDIFGNPIIVKREINYYKNDVIYYN